MKLPVLALEKLKGEGAGKPQWDVLFENVGGEIMDFVIGHEGTNARIAFSGMSSFRILPL